MKLLIASRNPHKVDEIRAIFNVPGLEIMGAADRPDLPDVLEDGPTFQANAVKKAISLALVARLWTLADDSGLEVAALHNDPGVRSARYAGEPADYAANNAKLLQALEGLTMRAAHFRCVVALSSPAGRAQTVEGLCEGDLITVARGSRGFGYDPLFVPRGYRQTFAEMDPGLKNQISHRAQALQLAMQYWGEIFRQNCADWPSRGAAGHRRRRPVQPL